MRYKSVVQRSVTNPSYPPDSATKLMLVGEQISSAAPLDQDRAFYPKTLLLCTFPHSDPGNVPRWKRQNGSFTLVVQPGWDVPSDSSLGIPYGSIPRLLMAWIVTEAARKRTRRLELGHSLSEFMRQIGLDPSHGGKKSDYVRLREAMRRLFGARITFHEALESGETIRGERVSSMDVAPERELWWDTSGDISQPTLWGSWIELGEKFYHAITSNIIPCDLRALKALKKSPLALDLYMLFNYQGATKKKPHTITWRMFSEQLGVDYADKANLKKKIKAATRKVQIAHPSLKITYPAQGGGITIHPSAPAIPRKQLQA